MTYKSLKIYTSLLSILLVLLIGIIACVQFPDLAEGAVSTDEKGSGDKPYQVIMKSTGASLAPRNAVVLYKAVDKGTLWEPIRAHLQFAMHDEHQPAVQKQIRWFAKNPVYLRDAVDRATPYIYYIYSEVKKRGLPSELVLLPIIESGYNPSATNSSSGATGLWQLISSTARGYGVHQDKSFDGRRDIYSSTNAALDYLSYLKSFFGGDWLLAIAAYDTGEGNVQNAIRHNTQNDKNTHFWALPLATETRSYIPRLLALAAIVRNPAKYGVTLPPVSAEPYLKLVSANANISLEKIAKLVGMRLTELKGLNPGIKNSSAPLKRDQLVLPLDRVALYQQQLAVLSSRKPPMNDLLALNQNPKTKGRSDNHRVQSADKLSGRHLSEKNKPKVDDEKQIYLVKHGDTLARIAKQYRVSIKELQGWNQLKTDQLKPGEKIKIMLS